MATKLETSPLATGAPSAGSRWRRLLAPSPVPSREDIRRDAAARMGVPVGLVDDSPVRHQASAETGDIRRPGRLAGWLRGLLSPEPAAARRQRIEAEAAAELGLHHGPDQPSH